jgi:hypothetical protein
MMQQLKQRHAGRRRVWLGRLPCWMRTPECGTRVGIVGRAGFLFSARTSDKSLFYGRCHRGKMILADPSRTRGFGRRDTVVVAWICQKITKAIGMTRPSFVAIATLTMLMREMGPIPEPPCRLAKGDFTYPCMVRYLAYWTLQGADGGELNQMNGV